MNFDGTKQKRFGNLITISKKELQDFIKNQTPIVKKGFDLELGKRDLVDLVKFKQPVQRKGYNIMVEGLPTKVTDKFKKMKDKPDSDSGKDFSTHHKGSMGADNMGASSEHDTYDFDDGGDEEGGVQSNEKDKVKRGYEPVTETLRKIIRKAIDELIEDNTCINCGDITNEDLRKWFGKGGAGGTTKGGWDRYGSSGQKLGKCGDGKEGGAYAACLSAEKAKKLGPKGRATFVNRKRRDQKKAGDSKKGKQKSKGKKPVMSKTGA